MAAALFLRAHSAPEAARLLPDGDAVLYVSLKPFHLASNFGSQTANREPEYEEFIRETGIQFDRDLDEAAIAVHPAEPSTANGSTEMQRRFSEVFIGHYDALNLKHYLHKQASSVESYRDHEVFVIPHEGRMVRVALLGVDIVAVSNTTDGATIRGIIDRYRAIALPFGGPALVRKHYQDVPLTSAAWAISSLTTPNGENATLPLPGGIGLALPKDTVTVASLRYLGSVQFKVEAFTSSESDAKRVTDSATNFLQLFRAIENNTQPSGPDPDVKTFFDSIKVEQKGSRSLLTAELPKGFLKKAFSATPDAALPIEEPRAREMTPAHKPTAKNKQ